MQAEAFAPDLGELADWAWPDALWPQALAALADQLGMAPVDMQTALASASASSGSAASVDEQGLPSAERLNWWAAWCGLEAQLVHHRAGEETARALSNASPAMLRLGRGPQAVWFALLPSPQRGFTGLSRPRLTLLGPDGRKRQVKAEQVAQCWQAAALQGLDDDLANLLRHLQGTARQRAVEALREERLASRTLGGLVLLRPPMSAPVRTQAKEYGLPPLLVAWMACAVAVYGLELAGWWLIGRDSLGQPLDGAGWWAWALLLLSLWPLRLLAQAFNSRIGLQLGTWVKQRLLVGAMALPPDEVKRHGVGYWLGLVHESSAFEALALNGGLAALPAIVELLLAVMLLASGAGGWAHAAMLLAVLPVVGVLLLRQVQHQSAWASLRLDLAQCLTEEMVGHRSRLVQQAPAHWHRREDVLMAAYAQASRRQDDGLLALVAGLPRGWLVLGLLGLGLLGLVPATAVATNEPQAWPLAVAVGGVLLGYQALISLLGSVLPLSQAWVSWRQVAPLWHAAGQAEAPGLLPPSGSQASHASGEAASADKPLPDQPLGPLMPPLLLAAGLGVQHSRSSALPPVLRPLDLAVQPGDRLLLQGPSGGGKSTLAAVLCGQREADAGLLLLHGLDQASWGRTAWRRRVAAAPQFHDNYIFSGPLAFNLLMGRAWPPSTEELEQAQALCVALGLGELLERMPGGLMQPVGETGWRLSHGERSRIFLARALLQGAELVVLDESFGALDPHTLSQCLRHVMRVCPALLVIAHP